MKKLTKDNLRLIHTIYMERTPTRISIANKMGMSLLKIASLLSELEEKGYIEKKGKLQSGSGRPSHIYTLVPDRNYSIGISINIDHYRIIVLDFGKNIISNRVYDLKAPKDPTEYLQHLEKEVSQTVLLLLEEFKNEGKEIITACASVTGMVDSSRGVWLLGLQVGGVKNVKIAEHLQEAIGIPFFIEDNSRSLAFYEQRLGKGADMEDFILLYLGNGVGAGLVINGEIYSGYHGVAGEIGHIPHGNSNYRCNCGNIGCLEAIISPEGIKRVITDRLKEGVVSSLGIHVQGEQNTLNLENILKAAKEGDRFAISTIYELGSFVGDACTTLIKLFNPQRIIISGYSSILKEFFEEAIEQKIKHSVILEMLIDYETVFTNYELHQEAFGAGLLAFHRYLQSMYQ